MSKDLVTICLVTWLLPSTIQVSRGLSLRFVNIGRIIVFPGYLTRGVSDIVDTFSFGTGGAKRKYIAVGCLPSPKKCGVMPGQHMCFPDFCN